MPMPKAKCPEWYGEASALYAGGWGTQALAEKFGCAPSWMWDMLNRFGSTTRPAKKYRKDEHFFDVIDTEAKAYFLGLLCADGSISRENNNFDVALLACDRSILRKFKVAIKHEGPIATRSANGVAQEMARLIVSSRKLVDALISHGCGPRKSLTLRLPSTVPDELFHHFFRGYFDGDGGISISKNKGWKNPHAQLSIIGSEPFCLALRDKMIALYGFKMSLSKSSRCDMWYLTSTGNGRAKAMADFMYKDATLSLTRKRRLFKRAIRIWDNDCWHRTPQLAA